MLQYVKRHLLSAGADRWEPIADECGVAKSVPRKLAYDKQDRANPRIRTIQPLFDFFRAVDEGRRCLPPAARRRENECEPRAQHSPAFAAD